jgi:NAD+ synthase (glutamine-hydrolysing)
MKLTLAQLNPTIGDIQGNLAKIEKTLSECSKDSPDLIIFPELFLVGYPPRDLLERPSFIARTQTAIERLLQISQNFRQGGIIVGAPQPNKQPTGKGIYNSALLIYQGELLFTHHKLLLPTYDVFDEPRYFEPGLQDSVVKFKDTILGVSVCEDAWNDPALWPRRTYHHDPIEAMAKKGAKLIINIAASPFHRGKEMLRYKIVRSHARKHRIPFVFVNQVGANDELIFDGRSICVDRAGDPIAVFPPFQEHIQTISLDQAVAPSSYEPQEEIESVYQALVLGLKDYMGKCGFNTATLGLSGGIDSAVTCCIAVEAIGRNNVVAVTMPGPYSSAGSVEDSEKLAGNLGIKFEKVPISPIYEAYLKSLRPHLKGTEADITEENIQARIRGNLLMAMSNKFGHLVLSTGNKSELAVGYCTLYGDMSGGLSVISDVPKTMVYEMAEYINRQSPVIPREIISKTPSAELKENQTDQDTLPPYEVLDQILHYYLDEQYSVENILDLDFDPETVSWVKRAVDRNEYKRRQAPPGLKVTSKAFGTGRRMPIAAKFES